MKFTEISIIYFQKTLKLFANQSFKQFRQNWQNANWSMIIFLSTCTLYKDWSNICQFKDSLKNLHIISAKRTLFPLIILTGISLSWIDFEESNICISSRTCSFETKLKENLGAFSCSEVIVKMLRWFLHFTIAFKVGWSMLSDKGSQPS